VGGTAICPPFPPICGTFWLISERTARKRDRSRDGLGLPAVTEVARGGEVVDSWFVGGRGTVPANRRPEVRLKELVVIVDVMTEPWSDLEDDELLDGTWLGQLLTDKLLLLLLLLMPLLSELDLVC